MLVCHAGGPGSSPGGRVFFRNMFHIIFLYKFFLKFIMYYNHFPFSSMITTYISYLLILSVGYIKDSFVNLKKLFQTKSKNDKIPILSDYQSFYSRNCFSRLSDCLAFPIHGRPDRIINIIERNFNLLTNKTIPLINFGSYNYLGFAGEKGRILKKLYKTIDKYPINLAAPTFEVSKFKIINKLEQKMAEFLHQEDCIVFPMGYGTNTSCIPSLLEEGTLVYSDELNHASLITGIKMSSAVVKVFKHNNMHELEKRLRFDISQGQPITHRSWKKIFVIVEGIYSMEGTILKLKELIELKKKYKFYIFIDEAHSIGAIGKSGRGVCDYCNVNFKDVDIFMGTYTKSFASMGGYIAGSKLLINYLRLYSDFSKFGEQMSSVVVKQTLETVKCIMNSRKGLQKINRLSRNTRMILQLYQ